MHPRADAERQHRQTVKIENLAIFKASVKSNACSRYRVMRATIGSKSVKVGGQAVETGNAVKSMELLALASTRPQN